MALERSILKGTKKNLGLDAGYTAFDHDVVTHINTAFFKLFQLGIGPSDGFAIEDDEALWDDFTDEELNRSVMNALQTYIYLKVRLVFDPPGTPHHIQAVKDQISELEQCLLTERNLSRWAVPSSSPSLP